MEGKCRILRLFSNLKSAFSDTFSKSFLALNIRNMLVPFFKKIENSMTLIIFLYRHNIFNIKHQNDHSNWFSDKSDEKVTHKKAHWLKLEFYYIYRKMEIAIRRIFISGVMLPNFIHFCPKIGFKIALESFTSLSWRLRTAYQMYVLNEISISDFLKISS